MSELLGGSFGSRRMLWFQIISSDTTAYTVDELTVDPTGISYASGFDLDGEAKFSDRYLVEQNGLITLTGHIDDLNSRASEIRFDVAGDTESLGVFPPHHLVADDARVHYFAEDPDVLTAAIALTYDRLSGELIGQSEYPFVPEKSFGRGALFSIDASQMGYVDFSRAFIILPAPGHQVTNRPSGEMTDGRGCGNDRPVGNIASVSVQSFSL